MSVGDPVAKRQLPFGPFDIRRTSWHCEMFTKEFHLLILVIPLKAANSLYATRNN